MKFNLFTFTIFLFLISCESSEPLVNANTGESDSSTLAENEGTASEVGNLSEVRVQLSDQWMAFENQIPKEFEELRVVKEVQKDPFQGYRIQIYSGDNVVTADTLAASFRAWADTTISNYVPDTYTFFKTPYYRVHVGDFNDRQRAINFSQFVKRAYRGAWVVYDRVEPTRVPADTLNIKLIDKSDKE